MNRAAINRLALASGLDACHYGPPLELGSKPSFFYFALSAEESLAADPYNQPILPLAEAGIRTFSFTLPYHGGGLSAKEAVPLWAKALIEGSPFLEEFLEQAVAAIEELIEKGWVDPQAIAAGGISRGGFTAAHLAARMPLIKTLLGFAPLSSFEQMEEFKEKGVPPVVEAYALKHLAPLLWDRSVRIYIGNRDLRVGTRQCFEFVSRWVEEAYLQGIKSPPIELILTPSIGFRGHGTPPQSFEAGSCWLREKFSACE